MSAESMLYGIDHTLPEMVADHTAVEASWLELDWAIGRTMEMLHREGEKLAA